MLGIKNEEMPEPSGKTWIGPAPWIETPLPGPRAGELIHRGERFAPPPETPGIPLVVNRAFGSVIEDADGNRFLDFASGNLVCTTGHCHPQVSAAVETQARASIHACGHDCYCPRAIELTERLARIAPGERRKRVLLTTGGTEAIKAAVRAAHHHKGRRWIVAFQGASPDHPVEPRSTADLSDRPASQSAPPPPEVHLVPYVPTDAIESTIFDDEVTPNKISVIVAEATPISGNIVPDPAFLPRIRALCDEHGILLVGNEIRTGIGRTGKWFAFEHFGIVPDIIVIGEGLASGMPLGAVVSYTDTKDWPPAGYGTPAAGNAICCAAALATLDVVESDYLKNAGSLGARMRAELIEIAERRKVVANVRGRGLIAGLDIVSRRTGKGDANRCRRLLEASFQRGLVLLRSGAFSIHLCPPLCMNETQLDVGLKLLDESIATVI